MATILDAIALAMQHFRSGNLLQAEESCRQVLEVDPDRADALHLSGLIAAQLGKYDLAIQYISQAIRLNPDFVDTRYDLGNVLLGQGKAAEATVQYQKAIRLDPSHAKAHNNLANALKSQGRLREAVVHYREALRYQPEYVLALYNLGIAFMEQDRQMDAIPRFRDVVRLKPDFAEAHNNLGTAIFEHLGGAGLEEAIAHYEEAVRLKPDFVDGRINLGNVLMEKASGTALTQAIAQYQEALRLPGGLQSRVKAHEHLAMAWLVAGNFEQGWSEYAQHLRLAGYTTIKELSIRPLWDGSPLAGRAILLHGERGLGQMIQFIRYAALVKMRGGKVIVRCEPVLVSLLKGCAGIDIVVADDAALPDFDVHACLQSLPHIFGTTLASVRGEVPYLSADPGLVEHWRHEFAPVPDFKIGICWQGDPTNSYDRRRSAPLRVFAPLGQLKGVRLYSLQKGPGNEPAQLDDALPVIDFGARLDQVSGALMDTAAIMQHLDLVVTVDTSVAHCAGALGVPVWVALPLAPDWRWLLEREDSPWYPTMRLFRQRQRDEWDEVFLRISNEIRKLPAYAARNG